MSAETLTLFHRILDILLVFCTFYQIVFFSAGLFLKADSPRNGKRRCYAVMIAARNEEAVISGLIESLRKQTYPADLLDIYVMSDHSRDLTVKKAEETGAVVFERKTLVGRGKGYVLHELWEKIRETGKTYDGYFIFDADNRAETDFVEKMNAVFSEKNAIVIGKRCPTNFGASWISSGYALWFLREGIVNRARTLFKSSCPVTGTGFLVAAELLEAEGGWQYFSLTEDAEFSAAMLLKGRRAVYADEAVFYDEQPIAFKASWRQRMRWSKGYIQVMKRYGLRLFGGIFRKDGLAFFDACMNILPVTVLTVISVTADLLSLGIGLAVGQPSILPLAYLFHTVLGAMIAVFLFGGATAIRERKNIPVSAPRLFLSCLTLPIFMMTYLPIAVTAVFRRVEWTPILHTGENK